jgi:serine/threonine protein kinase
MHAQLLVVAGPDAGRLFPLPLGTPLLVGRGRQTGTHLTDPQVSRVHCRIDLDGRHLVISDQDSSGGTFVNGRRIRRKALHRDDLIQIGDTQLRLELLDIPEHTTVLRPPPAPANLPADRMEELIGTRLARYQVGPLLAKGQSGLVFRSRDLKEERAVALKILWPELARDPKEVRRFVRAMRTMLPLRHVNLVSLYGAGRSAQYCWCAMEYVDGEGLTQLRLREGSAGTLDWQRALRVAVHISRALVFAHFHNIVHRNITPQNVLVARGTQVAKLGDLMLARALEGKRAEHVTSLNELLGDIRYLSPERTSGDPRLVDARSDLYSLGATIYALLAGRPPLESPSYVEAIVKIRQTRPQSPKLHQPALPAAFEAVVMRLLEKEPEDRFQRAAELLAELDRIARAERVEV